MTVDELLEHYPRAFHMAEVGSWDSIRRNGLRSTTALLDLFEITGEDRLRLESSRRPECVVIAHPAHGSATIRDQKVLSDSALERCLRGATPRQWYELLNGKTFFWLHPNRLTRLLRGRAYRGRSHCIITVDTARLLEHHREQIRLSPINSGSTIWNPVERSPATFQHIAEFPFQERRQSRPIENVVVELAVNYSVPNIADVALLVEHRAEERIVETLWRREEHRP